MFRSDRPVAAQRERACMRQPAGEVMASGRGALCDISTLDEPLQARRSSWEASVEGHQLETARQIGAISRQMPH